MTPHNRMMNVFNDIKTDRIKNIGKLNDKAFTKNRKITFDELIRFILTKKGKTTTMELNKDYVSNLVPIRPGRSYPRKPYTGINKHNQNHKRNS